jgi:hypothetical protein
MAQDQGMTSATHSKHAGKIVFAKDLSSIAFKKEKPNNFRNSFNASEPIYARLYLKKSVGNTPHEGSKAYAAVFMYDLYINGQKVPFKKAFGMYKHIPDSERTFFMNETTDQDIMHVWTTWRPTLLPNETDEELKYGDVNIMARSFAMALMEQEAGTHQIELKMYSRDIASGAETEVLASGSFTLKITEADKKALLFKYAPPLPKDEWAGSSKQKLIKDLTLAFENQLNKTPILVGLSGRDWSEGTYTLTGQKYRKVAAWAVFDDTDGDGQVPITTFNWISDYANGGWTKWRFDSHCLGCPNWDVEVDAVKMMANK